jgi:hypothetical protein
MKTKPLKIIICKDNSSYTIQTYLFSIGYNWKKSDDYDFEEEAKRFFGDIVLILLDDKTFAWESYSIFTNPYLEIFKNIPYVDSEVFLRNSKRKEKLKKINKKAS